MLNVPDFDDDFINSKDVIAHVTELRAMLEAGTAYDYEETEEEIAAWERLRDAFGDNRRWADGVVFVQDMSKYMDEFAEGQFGSDVRLSWPFTCVDWDRALAEFEQDYEEVCVIDDWGAEHCYRVR